jgi:hypothetical protein
MISSLDRWRYSSFRKKLATVPTEIIGDDQDGIALCRLPSRNYLLFFQ